MNEKKLWRAGTARIVGGELDGLLILAALDRIDEHLEALRSTLSSKKRARRGTSGPCGSTEARL